VARQLPRVRLGSFVDSKAGSLVEESIQRALSRVEVRLGKLMSHGLTLDDRRDLAIRRPSVPATTSVSGGSSKPSSATCFLSTSLHSTSL
jgi:hypothetical protein